MKKKNFITIRIDDGFKIDLEKVHSDLNEILPCGVSQTYAIRMLLTMGLESFQTGDGFQRLRSA